MGRILLETIGNEGILDTVGPTDHGMCIYSDLWTWLEMGIGEW